MQRKKTYTLEICDLIEDENFEDLKCKISNMIDHFNMQALSLAGKNSINLEHIMRDVVSFIIGADSFFNCEPEFYFIAVLLSMEDLKLKKIFAEQVEKQEKEFKPKALLSQAAEVKALMIEKKMDLHTAFVCQKPEVLGLFFICTADTPGHLPNVLNMIVFEYIVSFTHRDMQKILDQLYLMSFNAHLKVSLKDHISENKKPGGFFSFMKKAKEDQHPMGAYFYEVQKESEKATTKQDYVNYLAGAIELYPDEPHNVILRKEIERTTHTTPSLRK